MTEGELLAHYKRILGMVTPDGVAVVPAASDDIDAMLRSRLRAMYAAMLRKAPPELLPREDVHTLAETRYLDDTSCEIIFPERCLRPVSVSVAEWRLPLVRFVAPGSEEARTQTDPLTRATPSDPLAVEYHDRLIVYGVVRLPATPDFSRAGVEINPSLTKPRLTGLTMVRRPQEGIYEFDEELLASIDSGRWSI